MARPGLSSRAVLLRSVDVREADRLATFATERFGRLTGVCRGARKSTRRFVGALEPFTLLEVRMARGNSRIPAVSEIRVERAFPTILGSLPRLAYATCFMETAGALFGENDPDPELFAELEAFFHRMNDAEVEPCKVTTHAVLVVMGIGGYRPEVDVCGATGRQAPPSVPVHFDPVKGTIFSRLAGGAGPLLSADERTFVRLSATGAPVSALPTLTPDGTRGLFRVVIGFVEAQLGLTLKGARLVGQVDPSTG